MSLTPNLPEPLEGVLAQLAAQPNAWVRLAAARYGDFWEVEVCDIVTGAPPDSWKPERLIYRDGIFIAIQTKGATVTRWLNQARARLSGTTMAFQPLNPNPQAQREAGSAQNVYERSRWPTIRTDLIGAMAPANRQQPQGMLIGADLPTFQNFATAARYLLRDGSTAESTIYRRISYRHLDTSARIALVEYTDEDVWVTVEGEHLAGVTVELMGSTPGPTKKLRRAPQRPVHFKLESGIPRNSFVALVEGARCLDRKTLGWEFPVMQDPDVRRLVKFDPAARLQSLIYYKENDQVEFKGGLIGEADTDKETVMKTVAAFANGNGGSFFFGINKQYEAIGLREADIPEFQDSISNLIDDWVQPRPTWGFDLLMIPGSRSRLVVELIVNAGDWPPYGVGTTRRTLKYYVRHGARSVPARPDEVRALARSRPPSDPPTVPFSYQ